jgi:aminopeptidase N
MSKKVKRLFEGFEPKNYKLEINPDRDSMLLTGTVVIEGQKTGRPSQRITFHQKDLTITEATIQRGGKKPATITPSRISHHQSFNEVRLHADEMLYPGQYTVTLKFKGKITAGMHGVYPCYYDINGKKQALIATQFESHHAREAFPCIDEPAAKATFDLTITSPKGEAVLGNTPIKEQSEKDDRLVTTFETTPRMSTYLLAFACGDLQSKTTKTKDGVDVSVWATKAHQPESLDFGLDVAKRCIEFFNDYFGVPYPLPKADHIALPDFSSGAMENWGLITYREACLLADPATASQSTRELVATVICHETSHQWFGNLVTMKWWDDLWLNESFANVMEYVATDALFPNWEIWNSFITVEGLSALRRDSIAGVQAVKTEVNHPDEISAIFDPSIVYAKGGRLLRMLMQYIGEDDFRRGLTDYFKKHAYSNTTGDDLWQAIGQASGKDVAAFMNPWLFTSGYPVVKVRQLDSSLEISQQHFLLNPEKADTERMWPVPLLSNNPDVPALLSAKQLSASLQSSEYARINEGANGHYVVHYTEDKHAEAIAELIGQKKLGAAERLMLLSDNSMLARAGEISFAKTLTLLEQFKDEDREPVWDIMALIMADCRRFIDTRPELEKHIKALLRMLIRKQFDRLGWTEKTGEDIQDTKLRATITSLGVYAENEVITSQALELFEAYKKDPASVPAELRSIVMGAAVRNDIPDAFEHLIKVEENTSNVDLKHDIVAALTTTKNTAKVAVLLDRLKDANKVRPQDLMRWIAYLLRNRYSRAASWKWLRTNWDWIKDTFEGDKSYDYFPRYAANAFNTHELLAEYREFFEPMQDDLALARNIVMGVEEIGNRVAWLERDIDAVQSHLSQYT